MGTKDKLTAGEIFLYVLLFCSLLVFSDIYVANKLVVTVNLSVVYFAAKALNELYLLGREASPPNLVVSSNSLL